VVMSGFGTTEMLAEICHLTSKVGGYHYMDLYGTVPVVPHKAVAEGSKIGNL
jgi:hypothetical protein